MILPLVGRAACLTLALTVTLAGCSSSAKKTTGTSAPPGGSGTTSTGGGSAPDAATKAGITTAFTTFFNTKTTVADSVQALQHGETFRKTLVTESSGQYAHNTTSKVTGITMNSPDVAAVTFSLISGGQPLLPNAQGFAVRENGTWKVAAQTFCNLLTLEGTAPPACSDTSVTALPS